MSTNRSMRSDIQCSTRNYFWWQGIISPPVPCSLVPTGQNKAPLVLSADAHTFHWDSQFEALSTPPLPFMLANVKSEGLSTRICTVIMLPQLLVH
jgi:hypothetical protein